MKPQLRYLMNSMCSLYSDRKQSVTGPAHLKATCDPLCKIKLLSLSYIVSRFSCCLWGTGIHLNSIDIIWFLFISILLLPWDKTTGFRLNQRSDGWSTPASKLQSVASSGEIWSCGAQSPWATLLYNTICMILLYNKKQTQKVRHRDCITLEYKSTEIWKLCRVFRWSQGSSVNLVTGKTHMWERKTTSEDKWKKTQFTLISDKDHSKHKNDKHTVLDLSNNSLYHRRKVQM